MYKFERDNFGLLVTRISDNMPLPIEQVGKNLYEISFYEYYALEDDIYKAIADYENFEAMHYKKLDEQVKRFNLV